jgi:hypothetical protein
MVVGPDVAEDEIAQNWLQVVARDRGD